MTVGVAEGVTVGAMVGFKVGIAVGTAVGLTVGVAVGVSVGVGVGATSFSSTMLLFQSSYSVSSCSTSKYNIFVPDMSFLVALFHISTSEISFDCPEDNVFNVSVCITLPFSPPSLTTKDTFSASLPPLLVTVIKSLFFAVTARSLVVVSIVCFAVNCCSNVSSDVTEAVISEVVKSAGTEISISCSLCIPAASLSTNGPSYNTLPEASFTVIFT